jgi:hypothetical protein
MASSGIHCSDKLEGIERLAASVHLFEHDADGFFRGRTIKRDHRNLIAFEILDHLASKRAELITHCLVLIAAPVALKTVVPVVPVKHLRYGKHQLRIFAFRGGKIKNNLSAEIGSDHAILRHADNRIFAIR